MHISVTCPRCDSCYQVEPNLRGMNMRCPNPLCRAIFEVRDGADAAPPSPPAPAPAARDAAPVKQVSGSVGDIVPIIQAEAVPVAMPVMEPRPQAPLGVPPIREKPAPPSRKPAVVEQLPPSKPAQFVPPVAPAPPPGWEQGPPPVRGAPITEGQTAASLLTEAPEDDDFLSEEPEHLQEPSPDGTREVGAGTWEAPPVRTSVMPAHAAANNVAPVEAKMPVPTASHRSRRRARWVVAGLLLLLAAGLGSGFYIARGSRAGNEAERFKKAEKLYEDRSFAEAAAELQALHRDFPDSTDIKKYLFLKELASVRETAESSPSPLQAWASVRDFLRTSSGDPLLKEYAGDIWRTLRRLAEQLLAEVKVHMDRRLLVSTRAVLAEMAKFEAPRTDPAGTIREAEARASELEKQLAAKERREGFLNKMKALAQKPSADAVQQARFLLRDAGFTTDADFLQLLQQLVKEHSASVIHMPIAVTAAHKSAQLDTEPTLLVMPLLHKAAGPAPKIRGTLFALVRGVLYALEPGTGELRWAQRVGVDTSLLPLRVPAGPAAPAVAILTSSDHNTVWAVDESSGRTIWEHRMDGPCVAQPLLIGSASGPGNRLLLPGYFGRVDELRLSDGRLLGYYQLGQPLTVGGVQQPGSGLVYFAADSYSVYVLDTAARRCAAVLYSGHPRGSLRSAPVIINEPGAGPDGRGTLLLPQEAENAEAVNLRAFSLPITNPDQTPTTPDLKVPGWSWFPPYQDGERLALATDAGMFALFGIGRKGNRDPLFFPMVNDMVALDTTKRTRSGRAQIVHADAENFWVLAHGRLHRLEVAFTRQAGPKVIQRWQEPPLLGSPLHEAQTLTGEDGTTLLFMVTRIAGGQTSLATLVEAESGRFLWQRQLGIGGHGAPLKVGQDIVLDDRSSLFRFDAAKFRDQRWQSAGELLASFPLQAARRFTLAPATNDSAYFLHASGTTLKLVHYLPGAEKKMAVTEHTLPRPVAGTPCLGPDCVILPLDNGVLERVPFAGGPSVHGPDWRAPGAEEGASGHVVALAGTGDFVCTDGSRGLRRLHWSDPKLAEPKAKKELPRRIIAPPVVVSTAAEKKICIVVADADDTLTLLDAESLGEIRTWRMPGKITAGPFVRGSALACVVAGNRLIWIDPDRPRPLWEYAFVTGIVGEPLLLKDMVVVANVAGHIMSLDPTTGRPLGTGYTLRANVAPAATPVSFAADRLFLPLTDGTIMLLPLKLLQ